MCDDHSEADNARWLASRQTIDRRQFGMAGASAAALALFPGCASGADSDADAGADKAGKDAAGLTTASHSVTITTPDGTADAFFVHPAEGRHPAVIMWPDIAGLREAYQAMGTRLAAAGYAVLVVNQYYRSAPAPVLQSFAEWRTDAGQARLKPMIAAITPAGTVSDAGAFVDWLDTQASVDTAHKIGSCGYCMGGPFTIRTALARPGRVGAAASFHGANLVNDTPDSPDKQFAKIKAALLLAIAENDDSRDPAAKDKLKAAAQAASLPAEIEVYPAQHGWCTIDSPVYDKAQADKAWGRMLTLYEKYL
ncbi:MAG: dienelactone hydrolase [Sphingomonadales bacterium 32-67-7]|nr:MAG: dienelactone hydrolase [Sphingomonadales bacterium 32-67-7]